MNHGERDVNKISVILPARNEAANLRPLLEKLTAQLPGTEIVVVDDGSTDGTAAVCQEYGVRVVTHPYSMGNGAAVKAGARRATGDVLVFMDADGQHDPADIPRLLAKLAEGYAMAVGARRDHSQASWGRSVANRIYNRLASWMANYPVLDLTTYQFLTPP
ncbi:MAG: glycosyltransferase family 2 protein [Candidatus Competibacteraceae bacterium]|nr:glycosyltransferase family 2 protein [Candidatus Competibacteraceae bacterium]